MNREEFEKAVAAHYGMTVETLYLTVTGQPIWLDSFNKDAKKAHKRWDKFIQQCIDAATSQEAGE